MAFGSLWVTNSGTNLIQRFDPATNQVTFQLAIANPCNGITAGTASVWAASCSGGYIVRIDPHKNTITARTHLTLASDGEGLLAYGFGSVWAATGDGRLLRLEPDLTQVQATIPIPNGASAVVADPTAVWLTDPQGSRLLRIDPTTNRIPQHYATGGHPQFLATGFGSIWTLNQADGTVSRVDEATGRTTTIAAQSPGDGGYITTGLGAVWLTIYTKPLTRIDPTSNTITEQLTGKGGDGVITGFGSVWLLNNQMANMYRIAPSPP